MNIAEDERDSGLVELHEARGPALVESKIEALAFEQRKHIVKERIVVGELHFAADRDHQQRRLKAFILLHQLRNLRWVLPRRFDGCADGSQPDHRLRCVFAGDGRFWSARTCAFSDCWADAQTPLSAVRSRHHGEGRAKWGTDGFRNEFSKQNPHGQIDLIGSAAAAIDGEGVQASEFRRK